MKRVKEVKQRNGRKKINKTESSISKAVAGSQKSNVRRMLRAGDDMPNSSKVGAGTMTARRNLSLTTTHRRNHRTSKMIGLAFQLIPIKAPQTRLDELQSGFRGETKLGIMKYLIQWNEWVKTYGIENVIFTVRTVDNMKSISLKYGYEEMIEGYTDVLNDIES